MIIYRNIEVRTILAITLVAIGCQAAEPDESLGELQHFLDEVVESGTAGVSLRVAHGDAHWSGVAGVSNVEHQVDLQPGDSFPIFSVTKTFTAVVALQLIDEGRLSFDDTLGALLAGTRHGEDIERIPHGGDATIRQLLNYSSGFYDYGNSMEFLHETVGTDADFSKRWSIDELLSFAQDEKNAPTGTPGSTFSYTSTGYLLLGLVIEEIEKEPLEDVLARRLFQPLRFRASRTSGFLK